MKPSTVVNFRIMPGETVESVTAYVKEVIASLEIEITLLEGFGNNSSSVSVSDNQNFALIKNCIHRVTQDAQIIVTPYLVFGGTDTKYFSGLARAFIVFHLVVLSC